RLAESRKATTIDATCESIQLCHCVTHTRSEPVELSKPIRTRLWSTRFGRLVAPTRAAPTPIRRFSDNQQIPLDSGTLYNHVDSQSHHERATQKQHQLGKLVFC